jgi:hypothetical protein
MNTTVKPTHTQKWPQAEMPRLIKRPNLAGLGDAATSNIPAKD